MLLIENILLAFNALRANKMRALLTMLGIIIGIGSVIGIVNVGESMTNGISDSLSTMGISNITLSLSQKDDDNTSSGNFFMFGRSNPEESDLISDDMMDEYRGIYGDFISYNKRKFSFAVCNGKTGETNITDGNFIRTVWK